VACRSGDPLGSGTRPPDVAARPRGRVRADLVYLGWRQAPGEPDPGPPPVPPRAPSPDEVSAEWVAAQHRERGRLARPAWFAVAAGVVLAGLAGVIWLSSPVPGSALPHEALPRALAAPLPDALFRDALAGGLATLLALSGGGLTMAGGRQLWRTGRSLAAQLRAEEQRVAAFRSVQQRQHAARQDEHAGRYQAWQQRAAAFRRQPQWFPVTLPTSVHRLDVAGGTLAGWSALLTMLAAPRLAAGGAVTVIDLTEGGVAADLLAVARQSGLDPLVWVLPADVPRLELGADFDAGLLADVLAQTVSASEARISEASGGVTKARDAALLRRVFRALGDDCPGGSGGSSARGNCGGGSGGSPPRGNTATMAELIAALRVLGQLGAPAEHLDSGALTSQQLARLSTLSGHAASQLIVDRAVAMEACLQALAPLAAELPSLLPSRLKVAWLDRRASVVGNGVLATYLAVALTAVLRQAPPIRRWQQMICLLGAERLPGDVLDRLCDASESAGAGLVLAFRTIPAHVRERLGRGDAAVGFMRLGNAEDARLAAEQIGMRHRFVVSQLTETVGASVTDTVGASYSSSVNSSESVSDSESVTHTASRSRSHGQSRHGTLAPFADFTGSASRDVSESAAASDSTSITAGISVGTSWGLTTSRAVGASDSLGRTLQRSRESVVEPHELQQLPSSAVLLWYPAPGGRQVVLADANPAIIALPTATLALK
jgi:hypothetical protein